MNEMSKEKVNLYKWEVENGLNDLIQEQLRLIERLNNGHGAYRDDECEERLKLIRKRDQNDYILKYYFGIQSFQYYARPDFDGVSIV